MTQVKVDHDLIRALSKLLDETGLSELEVTEGDKKIRVARHLENISIPLGQPINPTNFEPQKTKTNENASETSQHPGAVTSPMVGTAYSSPEPGAEPFVKVGDTVNEGDTLIIIEAMKTMNPIRAHRSGQIVKILAENGSPIEFGEVLMVIE